MARTGIGGGHQRLSHEDGVVAGVGKRAGVVARRARPTRPPCTTPSGMAAAMRTARRVVDLERDEVALVHADERGADVEGHARARRSSWTSTSASRPMSPASSWKVAQLVAVEGGDDEQHAVGAHEPGVADVVVGDREVLAQHRQLGDGARPRSGRPASRRRTRGRSAPRGTAAPPSS